MISGVTRLVCKLHTESEPLHVAQVTPQQFSQLDNRSQQIRVVDDVPLALIVEAVQGVMLIAVLVFAARATQSSRRAA